MPYCPLKPPTSRKKSKKSMRSHSVICCVQFAIAAAVYIEIGCNTTLMVCHYLAENLTAITYHTANKAEYERTFTSLAKKR